jgi:hypothetical protein
MEECSTQGLFKQLEAVQPGQSKKETGEICPVCIPGKSRDIYVTSTGARAPKSLYEG